MSEDKGFVAFQFRGTAITFTISKPNFDQVGVDILSLGLTAGEVEGIRTKLADTFRSYIAEPVSQVTEGNAVKAAATGFPAKPAAVYGPPCGHGVETIRRDSARGSFWACQAKDASGTYFWKKGEGCKPINL